MVPTAGSGVGRDVSTTRTMAEAWLKSHIEDIGEVLPTTGVLQLPSGITIDLMFQKYTQTGLCWGSLLSHIVINIFVVILFRTEPLCLQEHIQKLLAFFKERHAVCDPQKRSFCCLWQMLAISCKNCTKCWVIMCLSLTLFL